MIWGVAFAYGPTNPTIREQLWADLSALSKRFQDLPLIIGGDFNVTLEGEDRPFGRGGQDPGFEQFRNILAQLGLQEMGPSDRQYTWRSGASPTACSCIDRFLCSVELMELNPMAEVVSRPRPISDHTPILWKTQERKNKPSYFKIDRSWFREESFEAGLEQWWKDQPSNDSAGAGLAVKLAGLKRRLIHVRRQIRADEMSHRDEALRRVEQLDSLEDSRPLSEEEAIERKQSRVIVVEADLRI